MKKFLALLLALTMVMSLVACGGSGSQGTDAPEETTQEETIDYSKYTVTEPVTIKMWHQYANEARLQWIADRTAEFNDTNGMGITVEAEYYGSYNDLATMIAGCVADGGKGLPGVVTINAPRVINFAYANIIEPLDNYLVALGDKVNMDDYLDAAMDAVTVKDQIYGFPFGTSAGCIIYNKTICDANNLPMPTDWTEFKEWCKNIYEATGKVAFSFINDFNYMNNFLINCTGVDPAGDGYVSNLDQEVFKTFVKDVKELCDKGYCVFWEKADDQMAAFGEQTLVAFTNTTNQITKCQKLADNNNFEIGTALGVTGTDKDPISTVSGAVLITFAQLSQNEKAAAAAYMAFMTNSENNLTWVIDTQMLPSHYSTIQSAELATLYEKYPGFKEVFDQADNIISKNKTPNLQPALEIFVDQMAAYVNGSTSEDDFWNSWDTIVEEVNDSLDSGWGN